MLNFALPSSMSLKSKVVVESADCRSVLICALVSSVAIQLSDDTTKISDNYFQLLRNTEKRVEIYSSTEKPTVDAVAFYHK